MSDDAKAKGQTRGHGRITYLHLSQFLLVLLAPCQSLLHTPSSERPLDLVHRHKGIDIDEFIDIGTVGHLNSSVKMAMAQAVVDQVAIQAAA